LPRAAGGAAGVVPGAGAIGGADGAGVAGGVCAEAGGGFWAWDGAAAPKTISAAKSKAASLGRAKGVPTIVRFSVGGAEQVGPRTL
jgi:hypothetical protein